MEVAGQWRREWAGTAEYGKVTEGGVTKRIARAMEVLHASAPGTRVRVLRAAFHSTAGPGAPASSYMLQSSRRVISSGYDFVEPQSLPSKPLEICSLPLEIADTDTDGENQNYKVTEPDDLDISEPSKWRRGFERSLIRMPSEESSSTDNASIIDLDSKILRRNSFKHQVLNDSPENLESVNHKNNRVSPLLDAPVTLSTLKYKYLLNGSNEWNNRRKSYSFEDTAPLNKIIFDKKERFTMESSIDSGICKSSEVVDDLENVRYLKLKQRNSETKEETFKDWLNKNKLKKSKSPRPVKKHNTTSKILCENNIILEPSGKVCITLPVTIEVESDQEPQNSNEENDRKSKKVEFCKTELHFAADTGTVNIIATDEKPPPTNDFRRRRSAFIPINDRFEKSVTLFGEKTEFYENCRRGSFTTKNNEFGDNDENTAATKSILKNKIPKPKPYLLGENMTLGNVDDFNILNKFDNKENVDRASGVSLINAQLKADKYNEETTSNYSTKLDSNAVIFHRTTNQGSYQNCSNNNLCQVLEGKYKTIGSHFETSNNISNSFINRKTQDIQKTPKLGRKNARQLRESDLMYFGIEKNQSTQKQQDIKLYDENNEQEIFESVRLVRRVSNSVCSSEIESDEAPEYQNISCRKNNPPVPAPRLRIKYYETQTETNSGSLRSIKEQETDENIPMISRRTRLRKQDTSSPSSRSISEPPKTSRLRKQLHDYYQKNVPINSDSVRRMDNILNKAHKQEAISQGSTYLYRNIKTKEANIAKNYRSNYIEDQKQIKSDIKDRNYGTERNKAEQSHKYHDNGPKKPVRRTNSSNSKNNVQYGSQPRSRSIIQRTEKLVTPELPRCGNRRIKNEESVYISNHMTPEKSFKEKISDQYRKVYKKRAIEANTYVKRPCQLL